MDPYESRYRPRLPSQLELYQEQEQQKKKRSRLIKRVKREAERYEARRAALAAVQENLAERLLHRSSGLTYSSVDGIGYKDFTLGPSGPMRTRTQLDRRAYAAARERRPPSRSLDVVPSLASCCVDLAAEHYGDPGIFDQLDPFHHLQHAPRLLDRILELMDDQVLPFDVWVDFSLRFGLNLKGKRKTYRGLCVGDREELLSLKELNREAIELWQQKYAGRPSPSADTFAPSFFLAVLDLSGDKTFGNDDISKLRDPLSTFLAVLRIDGTNVTDDGIAWIARATSEPGQYCHLQVLSLKDLNKVTNDSVLRLSKLNLRMLDLRGTGCSLDIRNRLNRALVDTAASTTFYRYPRARNDLASPLLELQLFGGSFSPSRTLSVLHHLSIIDNSRPADRPSAIASSLVKQLCVHLDSMVRRSSAPSAAFKADKTAEELYVHQMALANTSASSRVTHHPTFGGLTSTMTISRKSIEDDGRGESEKGAAFRYKNDAVAAGEWVGAGRVGGRATLYDVGVGKLTAAGIKKERDPFSDTEDEEEQEREWKEKEEDDMRQWDDEMRPGKVFYMGKRPTPRPPRQILAADNSKFLLLRHFPYLPPYALPAPSTVASPVEDVLVEPKLKEGVSLVKKKRKLEDPADSGFFTAASGRLSSSAAQYRRPLGAPSSLSSSTPSSFPSPLCAQHTPTSGFPPPSSSNPFSKKKPSFSTPRTARKNIVQTAPVLPKRSGLAAFRTK
ncbi:hypothetical protein JCM21900_006069 [Sporobolomyces salmonicolor]